MLQLVSKYFPHSGESQKQQLAALQQIYARWNAVINVISRKDIENFNVRHVLHSLSIAKMFDFPAGSTILDVGTGGGFPGIPLAIMFPEASFTLLDSTGKKIKVVSAVAEELGIGNVTAVHARAEDENGKYDFVVSRAVTEFGALARLARKNVRKAKEGEGGLVCLKGGDISSELGSFAGKVKIRNISDFFDEPFFETKMIVWLPSAFF